MNIPIRILIAPIVFVIYVITFSFLCFKGTFLFLKHGGEWITYTKDDKVSMAKIYEKLKSND